MADLLGIRSIAVIDDGFTPITLSSVPESDRGGVQRLLESTDDSDVIAELRERGLSVEDEDRQVDLILDALTDPGHEHGAAFVELSGISGALGKLIEERHSARRIAQHINSSGDYAIIELGPDDSLAEVSGCELVVIDYYLDPKTDDGTLAEGIATQVHESQEQGTQQQIVLMSSRDRPKELRKEFRKRAGLESTYFSFISKSDLDESWKVQAFLRWFETSRPYATSVNGYFASVKESLRSACGQLCELLDDLDLADLAYLQSRALQQDGHPLGEYLSWLFSSHLSSLAFECSLRKRQRSLDSIEFDEPLISPAEPSLIIAELYHSAMFSRNHGPLGPHPRSESGDQSHQFPLIELGDVFLHSSRPCALVILSAGCDLAFAPNTDRVPNKSDQILVLSGDIESVLSVKSGGSVRSLTGVQRGSEILCIHWKFHSYRSVAFGKLPRFLRSQGYDISNRDRLRPLYALQLQQEFARKVTRIGRPVSPPIRVQLRAQIILSTPRRSAPSIDDLDGECLVGSFYEGTCRLHLTTKVVQNMRDSLSELLSDMEFQLRYLTSVSAASKDQRDHRDLTAKKDALVRYLQDDEKWIALLQGRDLPDRDKSTKVGQSLYVTCGHKWTRPTEPYVALQVAHPLD